MCCTQNIGTPGTFYSKTPTVFVTAERSGQMQPDALVLELCKERWEILIRGNGHRETAEKKLFGRDEPNVIRRTRAWQLSRKWGRSCHGHGWENLFTTGGTGNRFVNKETPTTNCVLLSLICVEQKCQGGRKSEQSWTVSPCLLSSFKCVKDSASTLKIRVYTRTHPTLVSTCFNKFSVPNIVSICFNMCQHVSTSFPNFRTQVRWWMPTILFGVYEDRCFREASDLGRLKRLLEESSGAAGFHPSVASYWAFWRHFAELYKETSCQRLQLSTRLEFPGEVYEICTEEMRAPRDQPSPWCGA